MKLHTPPMQFGWHSQEEQEQQEEPNQQQQQQQANQDQPPEFVSPFKDIDRDLLGDAEKAAIEKAETDMKNLHVQAHQGKTWQSRYDKAQAALQQLQNVPQKKEEPKQDEPDEAAKLAKEFEVILRNEGLDEDSAKKAAKVQARLHLSQQTKNQQLIEESLAPLQEHDRVQGAIAQFEYARETMPRMQEDEVAQEVWQKLTEAVKHGLPATPELIDSFSKIAYMNWLDRQESAEYTSNNQNPMQQQQQHQTMPARMPGKPPSVNPTGGTRMTFPGSGAVRRAPSNGSPDFSGMDADTLAAVQATDAHWKKEYGITGKVQKTGMVIRTGGR